MENNRKGNGIFLGIVSVSTLVVAIIGATFAYFSASTQSNEDAVNLTAYEFSLTMSVTPVFPNGATKLIPLDPDKEVEGYEGDNDKNLLYALNVANDACIDNNKLQVCALYQVKIENNNTNPITLGGQIRTVTNTPGSGGEPFTNLKYQSVTTNTASDIDSLRTQRGFALLTSEETVKDTTINAVGTVDLPTDSDGLVTIDPIYVPAADSEGNAGVGVGYVLVYLDDNEDQSAEMGASYTGQLIYASTDDAGSTLSGTFTVTGPGE